MDQYPKEFDLSKRTATFGRRVVSFCKTIPQDAVSRPLISQLVRSATSIGANYAEANGASSRKDFTNKIYIARKEAQETRHWLEMFTALTEEKELTLLQQECHELILIFQKIRATLNERKFSFDH